MKVLLAHNTHRLTGGADVFYFEVGKSLQENGHEVAYFSTVHSDNIEVQGKSYFVDIKEYTEGGFANKMIRVPETIYSTKTKRVFRKAIEEFKPDLVHAFAVYSKLTPSFFDICKEENIPLILSCNDYKHICPNYKLFTNNEVCFRCKGNKFYNAFTHKCLKDSSAISFVGMMESYVHHNFLDIYKKNVHTFCFSSKFMADITKEFWADTKFNIDYIKNPFDSTKFSVSPVKENYCLYFGRLAYEKGVDLLLDAIKSYPNIPLKIVGNGPEEEKLKAIVETNRISNVEFLGSMWGEELNEILRKARFVIVPSKWHENYPYVINQSFAYGIPVIGSKKGGIPEMIGDDRGLVFEDINELKIQIEKLWKDEGLQRILGDNAKKWSDENFNQPIFNENIIRVYKKVIGSI